MRWLRLLLIFCLVSPVWGAARIAVASTGFTTATTWELVDASSTTGSSYLDSEAGTTAIPSPNPSYSANFLWAVTAPTVDGVAVKFATRAAVPSGTITVILRDTFGNADVKTVTVDVADINANSPQGWYFFKFDSATALLAANTYAIGVKSSAATQGTLYRDATAGNWSRMLRTTTTGAPAAGDQLHVLGEWIKQGGVTAITVTMDEVATTSYGPTVAGGPPQGFTVGSQGILNWGTTAKTNYILYVKGILRIYPGGTMNIGTVGTPMHSTSTALYQMTSVANVDSGLIVDGTLNVYGAAKTNVSTLLTANLAALGTVVQVADTTGWVAGDVLGFASTTRTSTQFESQIIQSVDSAVQVTLTVGVANAHSGTAPTQGEVINLTRNVVLRGASALLQGYILANSTATVATWYAEIYWLGSNTANKRGVVLLTTTGSAVAQYCALHDFSVANSLGFQTTGAAADNFTLSNNVLYNIAGTSFTVSTATSGTTWTISGNTAIGGTEGIAVNDVGGTISNNRCASQSSHGLDLAEAAIVGVFSGNTAHSNGGNGLIIDAVVTNSLLSNTTLWRNNSAQGGLVFNVANPSWLTFDGLVLFGNNTYNVFFNNGPFYYVTLKNMVSSGDSTFATTNGVSFNNGPFIGIVIQDSTLGVVAGIKTAHTKDITCNINLEQVNLNNVLLASATELSGFPGVTYRGSYVRMQKHDQAAGDHRRYETMGSALTNTATFKTASPSEELIPSSASIKMESGPKQAAVASGNTVTWSVWVYKHAGYTGAQPRLMLRANPSIGVNADLLLDTMGGGAGAWEELTGVTPAAAGDDGVFEVFVDCDTSGSIYVDDWSAGGVLISQNSAWWNAVPMVVAGGQPIGGDIYWWDAIPAKGFPSSAPGGGAVPVINNPILISKRGAYPR